MAKPEATWPAATSLHSGDVEWSGVQSHGEHFTHSRQEAAEQGTTLCDRARENPQARPEGLGVPQWHSDGLTEKSITGQPEQLERLPVSGTQSSLINAESGKDLWQGRCGRRHSEAQHTPGSHNQVTTWSLCKRKTSVWDK